MGDHIETGEISDADIKFSRGFVLDCWVTIKFEHTGQGFGGFVLGGSPFDNTSAAARHGEQKNIAADFIGGVMSVADVERFSDLQGRIVRVKRDRPMGNIRAIGHAYKEKWYCPEDRFELLGCKGGEV